jgi:Na+-driven multidrug efflux pump
MVVANLLQGLSGTLNNVFIGQMLGTHALAAVSGMFPIIKVKQIAGTAMALGLILGAFLPTCCRTRSTMRAR